MADDSAGSEHIKVSKRGGGRVNLLVGVIIIVLAAAAAFFYVKYQDATSSNPDATAARNTEDSERIISKLSQVLFISDDAGEPTVARVEDPDVLREANSDFYQHAQLNDFLILYSARAILYRESNDQIINVAPIVNVNQLSGDANNQ